MKSSIRSTKTPAVEGSTKPLKKRYSHPAENAVCPGCGAGTGFPCISMVPSFGIGVVGVPIEGIHAERIAAARKARRV